MKNKYLISIAIIIISFLMGTYFYGQVPDKIPTHWNAEGEADGFSSKEFGLFFIPGISLVLFGLMIIFPKIDPTNNIIKFEKYYFNLVIILLLFLLSLQIMTILWSLGNEIDVMYIVVPGISVLLYYSGIMMENTERNWFAGIRTPWTMSSDKVWKKTHKLGSKLFKISAVLIFLSLILGVFDIWIMVVLLLGLVVFTFVYSYLEYKKEKSN
ncbi:MAG: SdpI family protein [Candidatus ainarchaeum sp.]|nr:SdpI family protein [Candidatus ainarchaeum sp.]